MDNKITSDDIRGMLDEYSPDQQLENDARLISEGAKTLADASAQLKECVVALPLLINNMQKVTTLHISDKTKADLIKYGEETGEAVANAFKKNIETSIKDAQRSVMHVSCPALMAIVFLSLFVCLLLFTCIIIYLNYTIWDNNLVWKTLCLSGGLFTILFLLSAFMHQMEWI